MDNKNGYTDFTSSDSYKHQIDIWYRAYNISRERTELFHDFLLSLYDIVENTYLGDDLILTEYDQIGHFKWCWNKTIDNFNKEKIYFKEIGRHYEYLWNFFLEAFYYCKIDGTPIRIGEYIEKLFNFDIKKSRDELDLLTEIYKLMDQNLKK
jgi:hypothetical protein